MEEMRALGKGSLAAVIRAFLGIAWIVLWAIAAALALAGIAYLTVLGLIAAGVLQPSALAPSQLHVTIPGVELDNPVGAIWPVAIPGLLSAGVVVGGSLVIVGCLKRLFENITSGDPFRRENAAHLRTIWIAMIVIEVSRFLLLALTGALLAAFVPSVHGRISMETDLSTWGAILILIVLAEVFREGARLKEEQELTI